MTTVFTIKAHEPRQGRWHAAMYNEDGDELGMSSGNTAKDAAANVAIQVVNKEYREQRLAKA